MRAIRLRGFQIFKDRKGNWRVYHRKTRTAIDVLIFPLGSAEFLAECGRITALAEKNVVTAKAGTLGALICEYRNAPAFQDLAPQTQKDYQKIFDYLKPIADTPLVQFDRPTVVRLRDRTLALKKRRFANYVRAVLSLLFAWGSERGYMKDNPASGIRDVRRPKGAPEANRPWTDDERHAVLDAAPPHMLSAIALMMFTGLGPKDALTLPRTFWRNGEIATNRSKTGEPVYWPAVAELREVLENAPAHKAITLLANSRGRPWTRDGFRSSWEKLRLGLEAEGKVGGGLTLYGLRHTVAVILREAGFDERTIADALGQKTIEMARHYARGADLKPKMREVAHTMDAEMNRRRTRTVKLD